MAHLASAVPVSMDDTVSPPAIDNGNIPNFNRPDPRGSMGVAEADELVSRAERAGSIAQDISVLATTLEIGESHFCWRTAAELHRMAGVMWGRAARQLRAGQE